MTTHSEPAEIVKLLDYADNDIGVCTLQVLAFVMLADEEQAAEEKQLLTRIAGTSGLDDIVVEDIILLARERDVPSIEIACRALRDGMDPEGQVRFLELCISMVVADGYVTIPEQHTLHFLADLFSVGPEKLQKLYKAVAGTDLPPLGDPSSPEWWARQANGEQDRSDDHQEHRTEGEDQRRESAQSGSQSGEDLTSKTRHAYAILGLDPGASQSEIKEAYRMLAKVHHPDRFQKVGEEAANAANERFRQIKEAYDHLT
jgi:DnaJ like chaperone protein